jgi:hypothetical protein
MGKFNKTLAGILTAGALIFGAPDNSYKIGNDVAYGQSTFDENIRRANEAVRGMQDRANSESNSKRESAAAIEAARILAESNERIERMKIEEARKKEEEERARMQARQNWTSGLPEFFTFGTYEDSNGDGLLQPNEVRDLRNIFYTNENNFKIGLLNRVTPDLFGKKRNITIIGEQTKKSYNPIFCEGKEFTATESSVREFFVCYENISNLREKLPNDRSFQINYNIDGIVKKTLKFALINP